MDSFALILRFYLRSLKAAIHPELPTPNYIQPRRFVLQLDRFLGNQQMAIGNVEERESRNLSRYVSKRLKLSKDQFL